MIPWLVLLQTALSISVAGPDTNPEYWPLRVAQAEGYFAREGLAVQMRSARAEAPAAEALARGQVALAATSLDAALRLGHVGGMPPRLVFGLTGSPAVALLVPAPSGRAVRDVKDLAGRTVAIPAPGTPEHLVLLTLLARAQVKPGDLTLLSQGERGVAGALETGRVAAGMIGDPYATRLLEEGKATALVDLRRRAEAARWLGKATVHAAVFARPDTTLGAADLAPLGRALRLAMARLETAAPEELRERLPPAMTGLPEDFAARLRGAREIFLPGGRVTPEMIEDSVRLVLGRSPIPARVSLPGRLDRLLLMSPYEAVPDAQPR
jgi:hypothetical protein